jgi:flagellar export protein FliJ
MAKFKFRLATLLRLREATRDERRAELAEAYRADDVLREHLDRLGQELGRLQAQSRQVAGPGTVDVDRLVEVQRYEVTLRAQQNRLAGQREAVRAEIDRRRQALLAADRDVRLLEKLREKQVRRHRQEEHRREIKQLDEVAGQRATREKV